MNLKTNTLESLVSDLHAAVTLPSFTISGKMNPPNLCISCPSVLVPSLFCIPPSLLAPYNTLPLIL